ncbi:MAG: hypothetical protein QOD80_552 [Verrucomicrobiota bacterium]
MISFSARRASLPCIGKRMELRVAHLSARFAKKNIVTGLRVEWRIEID